MTNIVSFERLLCGAGNTHDHDPHVLRQFYGRSTALPFKFCPTTAFNGMVFDEWESLVVEGYITR